MTAQKVSFFLSGTGRLQSLTRAASRLLELQRVYQELAPANLAQFSKVGALEEGTLVLLAGNGAIAARLKQQLPTLLEKFLQRGVEVNAIRVEVQAGAQRVDFRPVHDKKIDATGLESLQKLENRLEDGPLKQALERLLEHQKR